MNSNSNRTNGTKNEYLVKVLTSIYTTSCRFPKWLISRQDSAILRVCPMFLMFETHLKLEYAQTQTRSFHGILKYIRKASLVNVMDSVLRFE